jgi:hypothetical protein
VQKFFRVSPFDAQRSLVVLLFPSIRSCIVCCGWITAPCLNCARRRPLCEEKDDDTQLCRHLSPRTVAEISGVLFKERCLSKRTVLTLSRSFLSPLCMEGKRMTCPVGRAKNPHSLFMGEMRQNFLFLPIPVLSALLALEDAADEDCQENELTDE